MYNSTIDGTCFLGVISEFDDNDNAPTAFEGGSGWVVAGFINKPWCKNAYNKMKEKYPILYQSDVRINKNTGNKCFFVVFDVKDAEHGYGPSAFNKASYEQTRGCKSFW